MKFLSLPARECLPQYPSSFALAPIVLPIVVFIFGAFKFTRRLGIGQSSYQLAKEVTT